MMIRLLLLLIICNVGCTSKDSSQLSDEEFWKLSWSMMELNPDYPDQKIIDKFDALLQSSQPLESHFLEIGLEHLIAANQIDRIHEIVNKQDTSTRYELCESGLFDDQEKYSFCKGYTPLEVTHPALQLKLIKMYINDQASRGQVDRKMMGKYNLSDDILMEEDDMMIDEYNKRELIKIIEEYGYPTKTMVGKDAMNTVFLVTQHGSVEWQRSQLPLIKKASDAGDLSFKDYAYVYDRVQMWQDKPQRYGSQSSGVDRETGEVYFHEIEDSINIDQRRKAIGLMPLDQYRKILKEVYATPR